MQRKPMKHVGQYVPLSDVSFGPAKIVMPTELPPSAMQFPSAQFNKMLNIPGVQQVYELERNGRAF